MVANAYDYFLKWFERQLVPNIVKNLFLMPCLIEWVSLIDYFD